MLEQPFRCCPCSPSVPKDAQGECPWTRAVRDTHPLRSVCRPTQDALGLARPHLTAGWTATANGIAHPQAARAPFSRAPENRPGQGSQLSKTRYPVAAWPHNDGRAPARRSMCCLPAGTDASSQPSAADLLSRVTRQNAPFPGSGALAPPTAAAGFRFSPGGGPAFHGDPTAAALDGHCWQLQPWMAGQLALRRPAEVKSPPPGGCPVSRARAYAGVLDLAQAG